MSTLTIDHIMNAAQFLKDMPQRPIVPHRVVYSTAALRHTDERLFPESKHRSRRIHKKLVKRHGGVYRKVPCMVTHGDTIFCHPALKSRLEHQLNLLGVKDDGPTRPQFGLYQATGI